MPLFTSSREKSLWFWAFLVFVTILSTLIIGQPLTKILRDQNIQAVIFVIGMLLVGATILVHGIKTKPSKIEIVLLLGIIAVYFMFFFRLGAPERSHLIEISVLAIFIHKALLERNKQGKKIPMLALIAILLTFVLGVIDESIQIFIPDRVYDVNDIIFNGFAGLMAIGSSVLLNWIHKRIKKNTTSSKN